MKIDLKKYLNHRDEIKDTNSTAGPVITLSRAYGCPSNEITVQLCKKIADWNNEHLHDATWKYINKEIIDEASEALNMPSDQIEKRLSEENQPILGLLSKISRFYRINDQKIIDRIKEIIINYSIKGHVIIVGRGAAHLTQNIEKALHIRLEAPLQWRAEETARIKNIDCDTAYGFVERIDKDRINFKEKISGKKYSANHYDIIYNCEKLRNKEIVNSIFDLMIQKGLLKKKNTLNPVKCK